MPKTFPTEPCAFEVAMYVRAQTTVEWWHLLDKQIQRAQRLDPDLAAELIAIRAALRNPDAEPGDIMGLLGTVEREAQGRATRTANQKNARALRANKDQLEVARATFDAWGGPAMTPVKRRECELEVAHSLGIERRKATRWFDYFLNP